MNEQIAVNRRAHIRFRPLTPVYVELTLWQVRDRELRSRAQRVLLRDIGLGGCSFATNLRLPVRDDVEWMVEVQLGHYAAKPRIVLLHCGEEDGLFFYGGQWKMAGLERQAFQYRFDEYVRLMLSASPHIHALYKKVIDRRDDGEFKRLDVTS
ncbi:hypothetical protein B1A99_03235 [Cohnella sp. CIP 111063]|uniref:hypothetical protein n=1 Tax=unclassified Cohnella TaxID=2636738 RepID=UPI000B8C1B64|nr:MULTISPECIES: hypothetical protein [unclassified Cohnella]OXS61645.1 hypothetical protein B1A99_03235 [Cohnella sp. CIP 111063]PRX74064.1 hypothetical protein B0G52_10289 [Cohnella sp. SGD-V74]